jgi:hypothetical protein
MPELSMPCGRAIPEMTLRAFRRGLLAGCKTVVFGVLGWSVRRAWNRHGGPPPRRPYGRFGGGLPARSRRVIHDKPPPKLDEQVAEWGSLFAENETKTDRPFKPDHNTGYKNLSPKVLGLQK